MDHRISENIGRAGRYEWVDETNNNGSTKKKGLTRSSFPPPYASSSSAGCRTCAVEGGRKEPVLADVQYLRRHTAGVQYLRRRTAGVQYLTAENGEPGIFTVKEEARLDLLVRGA